jgi:flavin reductase (DIM6/NTAB) family NADH-FMN oxidoreductase RutF
MKSERRVTTALYPLPVVLVTAGAGDEADMITIAWCGTVNGTPPMAAVAVRQSRHSYGLLCRTREFVINVPRAGQADVVDMAGLESGRTVDKFRTYGLTAAPATHVAPPLIAECPVNIECVIRHQLELGSHDLFIGEVVAVHADEELLDEKGDIDVARLEPFAYVEGEYWSLGERIGEFGFTAPIVKQRAQAAAGAADADAAATAESSGTSADPAAPSGES